MGFLMKFVLVFPLLTYKKRLLIQDKSKNIKQECYWCGDNFEAVRKKKFCSVDCREENRTYKWGDLTKNVHLSSTEGKKSCLWCGIDHLEKSYYCSDKCKDSYDLARNKQYTKIYEKGDIKPGIDQTDREPIDCYGHCTLPEQIIDLIGYTVSDDSYIYEDPVELFEKINEETTPAKYSDGSNYQPDKRAKNYGAFKYQNVLMGTRSELWLKKKTSGD